MIVVKLIGGLGNQMFQYAFGRYLSLHYKTDLFLDIGDLQNKNLNHTYRNFSLNNFTIDASIYHLNLNIEGITKKNLLQKIFSSSSSKNTLKLLREKKLFFDKEIGNATDNSYLDGYWQSPLYFKDIEDTIKKDLTFSTTLPKEAEHFLTQINGSNAVSIHIRRGDYISNPETKAYHGVCDINYYKKAMEIITGQLSNPTFFIFSDDPSWVKQNFDLSDTIKLVSNLGFSQSNDLQLMSSCKHAIIANSSFSWWGAWLIPNSTKTIIAPLKWLQDSTVNTDYLLPSTWIRI